MKFPLSLSFKILGLAPQIYVTDADGNSVFYVRQKLFKLREAVKVYRDSDQSELLYTIEADRILDFSAKYVFSDARGRLVGAVKRQGMRSVFRAAYDVTDDIGNKSLAIREESVFKRVLESFLGGIPIVGFFVTLLINPTYLVKDTNEAVLLRLVKKPAFFEGKFDVERVGGMSEGGETRAVLALLMMALLERSRG